MSFPLPPIPLPPNHTNVSPGPLIILVEPQMGENIGAAARAMLNFGLTGLRLVAPRDGWPNPKAGAMAAGAARVIDGARVFQTVAEAVSDCQFVLATTARQRELALPVYDPPAAAAALYAQITANAQTAILFGGERSGLSTEHIALANGIFTIPVNPDFASLNLGQAVLVAAYEWAKCATTVGTFESALAKSDVASTADIHRFFMHLDQELTKGGFYYPPEKTPVTQRNIRAPFMRAGLTRQEVQTFRGIIRALVKGRGRQ